MIGWSREARCIVYVSEKNIGKKGKKDAQSRAFGLWAISPEETSIASHFESSKYTSVVRSMAFGVSRGDPFAMCLGGLVSLGSQVRLSINRD